MCATLPTAGDVSARVQTFGWDVKQQTDKSFSESDKTLNVYDSIHNFLACCKL